MHAIGVSRIELAVVDLEVVVEHRGAHRRRLGRGQFGADLGDDVRTRPGAGACQQRWRHRLPALLPAAQLPVDEAIGAAEVGDPGLLGIEQVQFGQGVDDGEADPAGHVLVTGHARRDAAPDHLSFAVLDDEEVSAGDLVILAEQVGARRPVVMPPQPGQRPELAPHVVRADGDLAEWRPADDQAPVGELEQVRQVRGAIRELPHADQVAEAVEIRPQITR